MNSIAGYFRSIILFVSVIFMASGVKSFGEETSKTPIYVTITVTINSGKTHYKVGSCTVTSTPLFESRIKAKSVNTITNVALLVEDSSSLGMIEDTVMVLRNNGYSKIRILLYSDYYGKENRSTVGELASLGVQPYSNDAAELFRNAIIDNDCKCGRKKSLPAKYTTVEATMKSGKVVFSVGALILDSKNLLDNVSDAEVTDLRTNVAILAGRDVPQHDIEWIENICTVIVFT